MHLSLNAEVVVDRQAHVRQSRRRREPRRKSGRHRLVGEPGRDHRQAARRAADHASGRSARDRARRDHHAAQRRGKSQPVLPARLQSRSRQRLRHDRRRHAGQHADARAQPGLLRHQLPDSRTRRRRAVSRRGRTSPTRATSRPRAPATSTTRRGSIARSCTSRKGTYGFARGAVRRLPEGRQAAICWRRSKPRTTRDRGPFPTRTGSSTACCATARETPSMACRSRSWGITASGTRPRRRRNAPSTRD